MKSVLLTTALVLGCCTFSLAQGPGSGGPIPAPADPTAVPIDGGASLLLAGGVGYALRHLRRR
ncbi:PID-CTERM protein-sorting domain-containing protein, partial [Hymenobacter rubripertinctus]